MAEMNEAITGNAAKMLEALEAVDDAFSNGSLYASGDCQTPHDVSVFEDVRDKVKAALAAPCRNCDVGTAEERMHRYQALCREIDERHERFGEHAPAFAFPTPFAWEDRPYESEVKK